MSPNHIRTDARVPHPNNPGVWLTHFFSSADNDRLNNLEATIEPGSQIAPHIHAASTEFFYVVRGNGEALMDGVWVPVQPGDALKAPAGTEHGFRATGNTPLVLFCTFSPALR